ncbi:AlpA family transcriptional regulator [Motiliproteus sp. SC1-56]|uniref:helix-turn-helix transcriptional regulator n=1 Tax=Motiliproteus sp. SC1-56 TaxID=2799565 RepID=UPI001F5C1010|nr:AlpA family phage regulatory protein [Motiliproteus sp. SC1-56]
MKPYITPTPEQRTAALEAAGAQEGLCRDKERCSITSLSRSRTWQLEREGKHPKRIALGPNSVAWRRSDLLVWVEQQQCRNG